MHINGISAVNMSHLSLKVMSSSVKLLLADRLKVFLVNSEISSSLYVHLWA